MEYSLAAKINKSLKEKQKLIDAPLELIRERHGLQDNERSKRAHTAPSTDSKIDLKDCKVNTAEKRSNCHKHF